MNVSNDNQGPEPIAIIGISCRFPEAVNPTEFWYNLKNGRETLSTFSEEELVATGISESIYRHPNYVSRRGIIADIDKFDPDFFGYSEKDAEMIDPQQRLFLQCAYEAVEDAGYSIQNYKGVTGVFGGSRTSTYMSLLSSLLMPHGTVNSLNAILGNSVDQCCLRVAYGLGLKGPSITVQTACSTSLVAVHLACESIQNGECDMALAGACALFVPQNHGYLYEEGALLSPDGHCRTFDINAQGVVPGSGVGILVLKRLSEAMEDRDHIYALIKGTAVNNDGSDKLGFNSPSLNGQMAVIEEAIEFSGVNAESISYIEANGTATFIGDSIEIEALSKAFRKQTKKEHFCGIGAVKTNIGHLTQAAGIAGLIKTILALKNKKLPPTLNCKSPNPQLKNSPFYVVTELEDWKSNGRPRRAGVNAFAMGGTNAHIVLEEAPELQFSPQVQGAHLLTLSAKTDTALRRLVKRYQFYMESHPDISLQDLCYTSNIGRNHYLCRLALLGHTQEDLLKKMVSFAEADHPQERNGFSLKDDSSPADLKMVFLFSDNTRQYKKSYKVFYDRQKKFRETIDQCALYTRQLGISLASILLEDTSSVIINPLPPVAVFALQVAFARMWESWGIVPSAVTGYGVGAYSAACVAGVLNVEDAMRLLALSEENIPTVALSSPKIEILSPVTGDRVTHQEISKKEYWSTQSRPYISLEDSCCLAKQLFDCYLELGLGSAILDTWQKVCPSGDTIWLKPNSVDDNQYQETLCCLGKLYEYGMDIAWSEFNSETPGCRIPLPTYPFERKRCWFGD